MESDERNENVTGNEQIHNQKDDYEVIPLKGMFENYFLDYASYTILERAVPYIEDGLKPVQRRVLHSMKEMDDGRFNKVANVVGNTMKYHPHGDASIYTTMVNLGQKDLLIDCQGNWGNIFTGDGAAAARYIEARLSKFANEVVFNPKTTDWQSSYDGRNREPVTLPVKFPLLLVQGAEGIAVGLACKILPHNFNELIDASISCLKDEDFELYPDFPTGGMIDVSKYNDGIHGGRVLVRARISQIDKKTLVINEIPYGETTGSVIDTIVSANDKGKIKIKRVDDNTAENVEIVIHLNPGVSPDQTIDALYAFTNCQVSVSPNSCVIINQHPVFCGVKEILRYSTNRTMELLSWELRILLDELEDRWHWVSLEKIFFEKGIYKKMEKKDSKSWDEQVDEMERAFDPYRKRLKREITRDDVLKLCEKPVRKISVFDLKQADEQLADIEAKMEEAKFNLDHIVDYTINYFLHIKEKYGKDKDRRTEIRSFDTIRAASVAANNEKMYVNKVEGFICTSAGLKKEQNKDSYEYVTDCSDIDDIIVFRENGSFVVTKLTQKCYIGPNIVHVDVFHKNDDRTIYNVVYRDGRPGGNYYVKRFAVQGVVKDKEYDITAGTPESKVIYFTSNPNGEAEVIKVLLRPKPKLKKTSFEYNFAELAIKGRTSRGNLISKNAIKQVLKREDGVSTLGARDIWYDDTVKRLNVDRRGLYLGAFVSDDKILHIMSNGELKLTGYDLNTHFDDDMIELRKFDEGEIMSVIYIEGETQLPYIKRFVVESTQLNAPINFIGDNADARLVKISYDDLPRLIIAFNPDKNGNVPDPEEINVDEFIAVKGIKAKGKRISNKNLASYVFGEPYESAKDEPEEANDEKQEASTEEQQPVNIDVPFEVVDTTDNHDPEIKTTENGQIELF